MLDNLVNTIKNTYFYKFRFYIFIFSLFILFVLFNTYPLINNIAINQIGDGGDGVEGMWNLWQTQHSLKNFSNPYETDNIFAFTGIHLYLHSLSPLNGLFSIFLTPIFNNNFIAIYNIIIIFNLTLSGFCMFILSKEIIKNNYISIIVGYIYAFNPYIKGHLLGHLNLITTWVIPVYILFFIRFHKDQSYKNIFLCSLFLIIAHFSDYYYLYMLFIFSAIYIIYNYFKNRSIFKIDYLLKIFYIFITYFIIMSYLISGIIGSKISNQYADNWNPDYWSPDIATFFIPGPQFNISNFFKNSHIVNDVWNNSHIGAENQNFLGYSLIIIFIFGLFYIIKNKKYYILDKIYFWIILFFIMLIFVCGTQLKFFGGIYDINLPYYYIYNMLPLLSTSGRFMILVFLSFSLILGFILKVLTENTNSIIKKNIILTIAIIIIIIEYLWLPYPTYKYKYSSFYDSLYKENGDFIVYDISSRDKLGYIKSSGLHMYYQTIHNKKITDGRISRNNDNLIYIALKDLSTEEFKSYNIKYIIVDKVSKKIFNFPEVYKDNFIKVYKVY